MILVMVLAEGPLIKELHQVMDRFGCPQQFPGCLSVAKMPERAGARRCPKHISAVNPRGPPGWALPASRVWVRTSTRLESTPSWIAGVHPIAKDRRGRLHPEWAPPLYSQLAVGAAAPVAPQDQQLAPSAFEC